MAKRLYVHGDRHENGEDLWFCRRCDCFFSEADFSKPEHRECSSNYPRYASDLKRVNADIKVAKGQFYRPDNAENFVA